MAASGQRNTIRTQIVCGNVAVALKRLTRDEQPHFERKMLDLSKVFNLFLCSIQLKKIGELISVTAKRCLRWLQT